MSAMAAIFCRPPSANPKSGAKAEALLLYMAVVISYKGLQMLLEASEYAGLWQNSLKPYVSMGARFERTLSLGNVGHFVSGSVEFALVRNLNIQNIVWKGYPAEKMRI